MDSNRFKRWLFHGRRPGAERRTLDPQIRQNARLFPGDDS
jgi:hypothetical protein